MSWEHILRRLRSAVTFLGGSHEIEGERCSPEDNESCHEICESPPHYQRKKTTMEKIGIAEIVTVIESSEWNEYLTTWQYDAVLELAEYVRESQIIINGLLGAMTPKQKHRQWPNLTKRAKCLLMAKPSIPLQSKPK